MLTIKCKHQSEEILYVLDIVFNIFLGIDYIFEYSNISDIEINCSASKKTLMIKSCFFDTIKKDLLNSKIMPKEPLDIWKIQDSNLSSRLTDKNIPVLFGKKGFQYSKENIVLNIDIFASLFFMLSRYEEVIIKTRDNHDRFPATASIAYKENFLHRPIVDEYVEILWFLMHQLWPLLSRKKRIGKIQVSCDVDAPYSPAIKRLSAVARQSVGDIVKRKSITLAIKTLINPVATFFGNDRLDSYNTFDWIMDVNEKAGNKVAFYFISGSLAGDIDGCYTLKEKRIQALMQKIHHRGHEIGLHGSYNTYNNPEQLKKEMCKLKETMQILEIHQKEIGSRQHFLRWKASETASHLESIGIRYDTTLSFADQPGFRTGTCHEYPMYDLIQRRRLNLIQRPLIVMECSIIASRYMGLGYTNAAMEMFLSYKKTCQQFNGNFALLWHNSHLTTQNDRIFYKKLIN